MLSLFERASRQNTHHNRAVFILAMVLAVVVIPVSGLTSPVLAQDEGAADTTAADDGGGAGTDAAVPEVKSRNFLMWMMEALGLFWMLIFAALSFVMVALIMMNVLQVRRDVLLPNDFVEEFEQKLNGKDFQGAYEVARNDDSFVAP